MSVDDVLAGLDEHDYLADRGLATSILLMMRMPRPLFLEGEPGVGKTEVAKALAAWTGGRLIRLPCYEGIDASQALYEWDHARQLLHLRAVEARGAVSADVEDDLYTERFLVRRPLLDAINATDDQPPVLLIDEVDRADDEFEAFLLEVLADWSVTVPELGTIGTDRPPLTVITSNRTRDVHDALKRRCLYHWVDHPDLEREVAIVTRRVPAATGPLARQLAWLVDQFRAAHLYKPPGVAETVDWAHALTVLGVEQVDPTTVAATLGAVVKFHEDQQRLAPAIDGLVAEALERAG
jgi:MoxR-like ATPase